MQFSKGLNALTDVLYFSERVGVAKVNQIAINEHTRKMDSEYGNIHRCTEAI